MSVAYKPFFSTSYGDSFGYNEREGFNPRTFRNRYLDPLYEPAKTATAYNRFSQSAPLSATAAAATIHAPNRFASYNAPSAAPQPAYQFQPHPPTSSKPALHTAAPIAASGAAFADAFSHSAPISASAVYDESVRARYSNNLGFDPVSAPAHQSLQSLPAGDWSYSTTSSSALLTLPAGVYDSKPALRWDGKSPRPAAIGAGGPLPHPHPLLPSYDTDSYGKRDPAQQIPFGRLNARKPHELYERELKEDPNEYYHPSLHSSNYNRPGLEAHKIESSQNYGKLSISRRLPEQSRLRYHLPGYCGFVRTLQFRHGDTFGRSTRKSLLDVAENV